MASYLKGETLPNGTITHQIVEMEWFNGKAFIKRQYCVVVGDRKKKTAAKKKREQTKKVKAEKEMKDKVLEFTQVEQLEEGF